MQTITTKYSVNDYVWFIDSDTNQILRGQIDKIYVSIFSPDSSDVQTKLNYLIKTSDGDFYASIESNMADTSLELLTILQTTVDISDC